MAYCRGLLFVGLLWGLTPAALYGQFDDLASKAQHGTNAVLAIDVAALKTTPLATERGWTKKLEAAFLDRSIFLPPEASSVLVAGQLLPDQGFERVSEVAILKLTRPISMAGIARLNGGQMDELKGREAIATSRDAYLVSLSSDTLGIYSPANRQLAAQWVGEVSKSSSNGLSDYLREALAKGSATKQIILALELQDALSPDRVLTNVKAFKMPSGTMMKPEDIVDQLLTIRGVTVEIAVAKEAKATTRIDFGKPITFSDVLAKSLMIAAMQNSGMELEDLSGHRFKVAGNSIVADGQLSVGGLRRLMSLLEVPAEDLAAAPASDTTSAASSAGNQALRSMVYYKRVVSLLDDLRGDRSKQDPRGGMDAVWMDRYATTIDRLPLLGVDEELLTWGANTSQTLRVMATGRRGSGLAAGAAKSGLRTGVSSDGYYGVTVTSATATQANANQIDVTQGNAATAKRVEGWRLIDNATAEIRRKQTQRYQVEF